MRFFVGLHQLSDAPRVGCPCMISVNRLRGRKKLLADVWVMDSGAFTSVALRGGYDHPPSAYAVEIRRWAGCGQLLWAASQDFMCEPFVLARTGLTVTDHQRMTIERYDALAACDAGGVTILPVLQGFWPDDYRRHVAAYGDRLHERAWVGVGSVCKRNASITEIGAVLRAIKLDRPDLRLHGFGVKTTALADGGVRSILHSADSMAWSYSARKQGRGGNDWRDARAFVERVTAWKPDPLPLLDAA